MTSSTSFMYYYLFFKIKGPSHFLRTNNLIFFLEYIVNASFYCCAKLPHFVLYLENSGILLILLGASKPKMVFHHS